MLPHAQLAWPLARIPTTSNSAAAASSRKKPAPVARHILSFARAAKPALTARRRNACAEAKKSAALLGATVEFIELDGDAHLEVRAAHAIKLAGIIRRVRPGIVLAPSLVENQHPDHARLGQLVRDACRLARYGGVKELRRAPSHAIEQLFYYAVTPEAEPANITPVLIDVSAPEILKAWTAGDGSARFADFRPQLRRTATHAGAIARVARRASAMPSRCFRTIRWCLDSLAQVSRECARAILIWLPGEHPSENRHRLLSERRRQRHSRHRAGRGTGAART